MENTKVMFIQLPEETYRRLHIYLKRHGMMQKEFIDMVLRRALDQEVGSADSHKQNDTRK